MGKGQVIGKLILYAPLNCTGVRGGQWTATIECPRQVWLKNDRDYVKRGNAMRAGERLARMFGIQLTMIVARDGFNADKILWKDANA